MYADLKQPQAPSSLQNLKRKETIEKVPRAEGMGDWQAYYESMALDWDNWAAKIRGYRRQIERYLAYCIPPGSRVLEVGCATGALLQSLQPSRGLGIDFSTMIEIARDKYPNLEFRNVSPEDFDTEETFDYIILDSLVGSLEDVQYVLGRLSKFCNPETRLILSCHNALWEPLFGLAEWVGLRRKHPVQNWISSSQMSNLLQLAGFHVIRIDQRHFFPFAVPVVESLFERFLGRLPILRHLNLMTWFVARHKFSLRVSSPKVSVICPCRNEDGNIRSVVERLPYLGDRTELIFVEGNSQDNTLKKCHQVALDFPERKISVIQQGNGTGKGDAVRKGYAAATGDILMILDADLSVPPEDLVKFYEAIAYEKGEFVNGTRLVYPMEKDAMRFLNKLANKGFSLIFSWILGQHLTDTLCGTKVLWRKDYERLAASRSFFGDFDPFGDFDLIFGAAKLGLHIVEVPVRYRERKYGATNISRFKHGWLLLKMSALAAKRICFY